MTFSRVVLEAADGIGMTPRQRLVLVELPLGAPVILAGIRTASVWTIGAATLATTVGQSSPLSACHDRSAAPRAAESFASNWCTSAAKTSAMT